MNLSKTILKLFGWSVDITVPDFPKCIICVAPHTSNWDFVLGKLAYASVGRKSGFLMKETWFFPPLGWIFKAIGGIPVPRKRGSSLTDAIIARFNATAKMTLAITPEGTRSLNSNWRTGFLRIAQATGAAIVLGVLDFEHKRVIITEQFVPTGDLEADMRAIKDYYKPFKGKYPEKFSTEDPE